MLLRLSDDGFASLFAKMAVLNLSLFSAGARSAQATIIQPPKKTIQLTVGCQKKRQPEYTETRINTPYNLLFFYRVLIHRIKAQQLIVDEMHRTLAFGMKVSVEMEVGIRTIIKYSLPLMMGAFHQAGGSGKNGYV